MLSYHRAGANGRPRDLAITDFRFVERPVAVLAGRNGHRYLLYASGSDARASHAHPVAGARANPTRRLAESVLYAFSGVCVMATVWFGFVVPIVPMPAPIAPMPPATAAYTSSTTPLNGPWSLSGGFLDRLVYR
ncbi:MAG: hypothetical protein QOJ39_851 [Candidatus Eremiobacteraeota bacterium]|jgi:hypothetical protein|nr:hypothetical protein [Candidatus Eremiobacteraeota bacterium]